MVEATLVTGRKLGEGPSLRDRREERVVKVREHLSSCPDILDLAKSYAIFLADGEGIFMDSLHRASVDYGRTRHYERQSTLSRVLRGLSAMGDVQGIIGNTRGNTGLILDLEIAKLLGQYGTDQLSEADKALLEMGFIRSRTRL